MARRIDECARGGERRRDVDAGNGSRYVCE
jgi:hypothetical protein